MAELASRRPNMQGWSEALAPSISRLLRLDETPDAANEHLCQAAKRRDLR